VNWLLFAVLSWVFVGLEKGLRDALSIGQSGIAPSFVFVLLTSVALSAPRPTVMWASVALGLVMDLVFEIPLRQSGGTLTIPGPHALAYVLGAQLILAMRPLMIRRNPLTLGFLSMVGSLIANLTIATILSLRHWVGAPIAWETKHEFVAALGSAAYTGVLGLFLAFVLLPLASPLGMSMSQQQRRFAPRW
jgi:rod shape-determining protein MreD